MQTETGLQPKDTNNAVMNSDFSDSDFGNLDASDIQIPRLHLLQAMSDGVSEGDFKIGDIIHTTDQVVLGGRTEPVIFIPFHVMKINQKFRTDVSPKEYVCTEPFTHDRPWEEDYVWTRRDGQVINCHVNNYKTVIVHGILAADDNDMALPVSITFRSSAGKGGRAIMNHFATVAEFNRMRGTNNRPYKFAWELTSELVTGDSGKYAVWVCKKARKATEEEMEECDNWAAALNANMMAYADHSGEQENIIVSDTSPKTEENSTQPVNMDDVPF